MRDYATIEQLLVLANLENINAYLIAQGISQDKRLQELHAIAISQMEKLINSPASDKLYALDHTSSLLSES